MARMKAAVFVEPGRIVLDEMLLGSVSQVVIQRAAVPVTIVNHETWVEACVPERARGGPVLP